jgi:hypothetical protein
MLADYQQALVDLTASPEFCTRALEHPAILTDRYRLTERELNRIVGIIRHPGMECACTIYRANRLAPLAMNAPETCRSLGSALRSLLDEFWTTHTDTAVHFFVETDRFLQFLRAKVARGDDVPAGVSEPLSRESARIAGAVAESYTERDHDVESHGQRVASAGRLRAQFVTRSR